MVTAKGLTFAFIDGQTARFLRSRPNRSADVTILGTVNGWGCLTVREEMTVCQCPTLSRETGP
jgi:hypothetical protein